MAASPLMVQEVFGLPEWEGVLSADDRRLTPPFWRHILPYVAAVRANIGPTAGPARTAYRACPEPLLLVGWCQLP